MALPYYIVLTQSIVGYNTYNVVKLKPRLHVLHEPDENKIRPLSLADTQGLGSGFDSKVLCGDCKMQQVPNSE